MSIYNILKDGVKVVDNSEYENELCAYCKQPILEGEWAKKHSICPWFESRSGPEGAWHDYYCSEACANHADEISAEKWKEYHALRRSR